MNPFPKPPFYQIGGHIQTIYPSIFRKVEISYLRERLELEDGDFLDIDWHITGSKKLIVVTHGLEGDSHRPYVTALIKLFAENGWDGLGWNCRSCSGEMNRLPRFYHHGDASDLKTVVEYAITKGYEEIFLSGSSMGGSLSLRWLTEHPENVPEQVSGAFVASVPLDIFDSVKELSRPGRWFYMNRFLKKLYQKMKAKQEMFPDNPLVNTDNFKQIKNFIDFDDRYTAPLHGYSSAHDFYTRASVKPLLSRIQVPVLIVQAINDPFLGVECYNTGKNKNPNIHLQITPKGGHVGFMESGQLYTWAEKKALDFYKEVIEKK